MRFKRLACVMTEAGKSKICKASQQDREPEKGPGCSSSPKTASRQHSLLLGKVGLFVLLRPSTD